jgi:enamine deaminase RidA (YjgF/YER057c/UK114 family)
LVFVSGQVALDADGRLVGKGDLEAQLEQAWRNLVNALASVGATPADLVKVTTFVVGYRTEHRALITRVRGAWVGEVDLPTSTLVGVTSLALPEFLVEVEGTAALSNDP